jgi:hypothetical protein
MATPVGTASRSRAPAARSSSAPLTSSDAAPPRPVEQRDHLRHRGHLDRARHPQAERGAHHEPGGDHRVRHDRPVEQRDQHGEQHPDARQLVAAARGVGAAEPLEAEDEEDAATR